MPLVVICGQPCSGKSTLAAKLVNLFQEAGLPVELVDELSLHLERNAAYTGARCLVCCFCSLQPRGAGVRGGELVERAVGARGALGKLGRCVRRHRHSAPLRLRVL